VRTDWPALTPDTSFAVILAGPSGAGKTTLRDRLLAPEMDERCTFSVSLTTRPPREGEREGTDYRFVDRDEFTRIVDSGGMLEHATVHGDLYGTPIANLDRASSAGKHLLLDIDVQGARQVREAVADVITIFVLPPSVSEMLRRLRGRGSENEAQLGRRYESALAELEAFPEFGYAVVNDDLDEAVRTVCSIMDAEERSVARLGSRAEAFADRLKDEIRRQMH